MTDVDRAFYLLALESPPTHQAALGPPLLATVFGEKSSGLSCIWVGKGGRGEGWVVEEWLGGLGF